MMASPGRALLWFAYFVLHLRFHGYSNTFNYLKIALLAWVPLCLFAMILMYYFWSQLLLLILCFDFFPQVLVGVRSYAL